MVFGTVVAFVCAFAVADAGYLHIFLKNIGRKGDGILVFLHIL